MGYSVPTRPDFKTGVGEKNFNRVRTNPSQTRPVAILINHHMALYFNFFSKRTRPGFFTLQTSLTQFKYFKYAFNK